MVKVLCTFWAMILHAGGIYIFQTCCENSTEDDHEQFLSIPPVPAFFFASGVYVMLAHVSLLPSSFQKPIAPILCAYELISSTFILEFCVGCIWGPVNVLILTTLPKAICHALHRLEDHEIAQWIEMNNHVPMLVLLYIISVGFFGIALHVSTALDFSIFTEFGPTVFLDCAGHRLLHRIRRELAPLRSSPSQCSGVKIPRVPRRPRRRRRPFKECDCEDNLVIGE